jgi:DNA modification methylase
MTKINLNQDDLKKLTECINDQTEIPQDLLIKLSPSFFDKLHQEGKFDFQKLTKYKIPTIEYAGKRLESVILAQTAIVGEAAPLQVVRNFGDAPDTAWQNMIVQGDNLQFLKTCYLNHDPLIKDKVKGKVKLIYIDPPFGTGDEYGGRNGGMSYSAKTMGAEFIEILRERLIYLREILSVDGNIFVRIDYRFGYHIKIVLDEIFGKQNFKNHLVINKSARPVEQINQFHSTHDFLFFYSKSNKSFFYNFEVIRENPKWRPMHLPGIRWSPIPEKYVCFFSKENLIQKNGKYHSRARVILNRELLPPQNRHWALNQDKIFSYERENKIRLNKNGNPESIESNMKKINDQWTDIPGYAQTTGYPTENSEPLLERAIISGTTGINDLVLDCFAGSGTTAAVAEKLGRRWIMCDFGKHAIYTMQKRIWNIASSKKLGQEAKKNEKYEQPPKPFSIISAGVYDFSRIMNLRKNKKAYINFVLGLFSIIREEKDYASKYKLSNIYAEKENNPVEVYPVWDDEYLKEVRIDEEYLKEIIRATGGRLKGHYYIVTPESCTIITNTTLKNSNNEDVKFILLKFPYKVLEDVSRHFQIKDQPASAGDINKLISSAGFYFNEEIKIEVEKIPKGFKIKYFSTGILNQDKERYEGLKGLSMIMIDRNYNGQAFNLDQAIYKNEITDEGIIKIEGLTKDSHLIAIDKHGNESKVIKI